MALTPVQTLDAGPILRAIADPTPYPNLVAAIDVAAAVEQAWLIDHAVRLGRLTAYERLAHLVLEIRSRLAVMGPEPDGRLPFPLTQETLADALGLSMVHVNRTLQQLRRDKLIEIGQGRLKILDIEALSDISDFREPKPIAWTFDSPD